MMALPFVFVIFIINFEAGLIVYWITTNVWTIGQQLVVRKLYPRPDLEDADGAVPAGAAALAGGKKSGPRADGDGAGPAKKPPPSPRKKKKRSGRRR
jgi:YidC/Oxa1 family membrane protein insertase